MPTERTPQIRGARAFLDELRDPGRNLKEKYKDDPLALAERFGIKLPKKPVQVMQELGVYDPEKHGPIEPGIRDLVHDVCTLAVKSAVACASRGGGKSFGASFIEFFLWMILDFDALNLGGSELQADAVYQYMLNYLDNDEFWKTLIRGEPQKEKTYTKEDSWVRVLAASQKSVRSPHAGGLRKGKIRGGILVIDEEAEADPGIVEAALPTINTARPSVNVRVSTFHNIGGSFQDVMDNHVEMGYCADDKTEILTQRGWLSGIELQPWDLVLSVDAEGSTHWSRVKKIYRNHDYSGPMLRIRQRFVSGLVTPHHRLMLSDGSFTTAAEINAPYSQADGWREQHRLRLIGTPAPDGPGIYSDDFVELVAWFVAEGHWIHSRGGKKVWNEDHTAKEYRYYKGKIRSFGISQNPGEHMDQIKSLLKRMGQHFVVRQVGDCEQVHVRGPLVRHLLSVCSHQHRGSTRKQLAKSGKTLTADFCSSLTQDQRLLFLDTFIAADGSETPNHERSDGSRYVQRYIAQHKGPRSDSIQMICTLAGIPTTQSKNGISLRTTTDTIVYDKHIDERQYEGTIWCPETEYGTWISRRNGVVSLTGNTLYRWDIFDVCSGCECVGPDCESEESCFREDHFEDYIDPDDGELKQRLVHKAYCNGRAQYADGWIPMEEIVTLWKRMKRSHYRWEIEAMGQRPSSSGYAIRDLIKFSDSIVSTTGAGLYVAGRPVTICVDWGTGAAGVEVWQEQSFGKHALIECELMKDNNQTQIFGAIVGFANKYRGDLKEVAADIGGGGNYLNEDLRMKHRLPVRDVNFGEIKESALAVWNALNEADATKIPQEFTEFVDQVKGWVRKNGRIQKGKDHLCDAALCYFSGFIEQMGTGHIRIAPRSMITAPTASPVTVRTTEERELPSRRATGRVPVVRSVSSGRGRGRRPR